MGFFKAYDMRGTFGVDFDLDTVQCVGRALPRVVGGARWLVGRDGRDTSPDLSRALVRGLAEAGAEVTDLGLCTTPMVYFFTAEGGYDGSVMVTASHNPLGDNGLKVSRALAVPVGYADGLDKIEEAIKNHGDSSFALKQLSIRAIEHSSEEVSNAQLPKCSIASIQSNNRKIDESKNLSARSRYVEWHRSATPDPSGLRYAVDCSNGTAALLARDLFPGAEILNGTVDGRFPAHAPNPLLAEARAQLAARVREGGLDCGVIFDGDADRAMFVDETGAFVQPDSLIPLVARAACAARTEREAPVRVLHDVRTSRAVIEELRAMGAEPVMVPVGHVFAKKAMRARGAACGGELAGHYYFREFHCCDSGILAARRILGEVARAKARGLTFSRLMAPITARYANSGELNFRVADKAAAVGRVITAARTRLPPERSHSRLDGLRFEYDAGWFNLRASNTEPYLRLVAECDTPARLADWLGILTKAIEG